MRSRTRSRRGLLCPKLLLFLVFALQLLPVLPAQANSRFTQKCVGIAQRVSAAIQSVGKRLSSSTPRHIETAKSFYSEKVQMIRDGILAEWLRQSLALEEDGIPVWLVGEPLEGAQKIVLTEQEVRDVLSSLEGPISEGATIQWRGQSLRVDRLAPVVPEGGFDLDGELAARLFWLSKIEAETQAPPDLFTLMPDVSLGQITEADSRRFGDSVIARHRSWIRGETGGKELLGLGMIKKLSERYGDEYLKTYRRVISQSIVSETDLHFGGLRDVDKLRVIRILNEEIRALDPDFPGIREVLDS